MTLIDVLLMPINKIKKLIGTTTDTGGSFTSGTVMGKLNSIISNNSSNIGTTTDTGATATTGTVMGKLNALVVSKVFKHFIVAVGTDQADYTVVSVTGAGEFYGLYGPFSVVKVIADGVEFSAAGNGYDSIFKPGIYNGLYRIQDASASSAANSSNEYVARCTQSMPFKNSLVIKASTTGGVGATHAKGSYALYE